MPGEPPDAVPVRQQILDDSDDRNTLMSRLTRDTVRFADLIPAVRSATSQDVEVWEYFGSARQSNPATAAQRAADCLQVPLDFPPIRDAIVPGDKVTLAVDPNVPELAEVIRGVATAVQAADAGSVTVAVWDEASDETIEALKEIDLPGIQIERHNCENREQLRYLAADDLADPVYLNRSVIDADFVLPVISRRATDAVHQNDPTGVFPAMADSATRNRLRDLGDPAKQETKLPQIGWLLGVHVLVTINADADGLAGSVIAGTPEAIVRQSNGRERGPDDAPPSASLLIASLDGDGQQQTWANAARAIDAALNYVAPGGTIVLWTEISESPANALQEITDESTDGSVPPESDSDSEQPPEPVSDSDDEDDENAKPEDTTPVNGDGFPRWDATVQIARLIARVSADHRVVLHSRLTAAEVESAGLGVVDSVDELKHLVASAPSVGVLRAAQFAGGSHDLPTE